MKTKYILDSNICIHLLRNRQEVVDAIAKVGWDMCCISELTVVELFYGAECSESISAIAEYGVEVTASVERDNVYGTQFHPEKSGEVGLGILRAFCEM